MNPGRTPLPVLLCLFALGLLASPAQAAPPIPYWDLGDLRGPGQIMIMNSDSEDGKNGVPVKAVDLNGDGRDEVIMSAFNGDGPQNGPFRDRAGEIHIFFWDGTPFQGQIDFRRSDPRVLEILGPTTEEYFGCALNHADIDGDGIRDLMIGAFGAGDLGRTNAGKVYILFGDSGLAGGGTIDLADGVPTSFTTILGAQADDRLGVWHSAGDVNGDGWVDLILGADRSDGPAGARPQAGKIVVVYGPIPRGDEIDLATGGFNTTVIWGVDTEDHFGATVECADFDGDGFADIVGAAASHGLSRNTYDSGGSGDGPPGINRTDAGETWIVWGNASLPTDIDLANPPPLSLTAIYGRHSFARCGEELDIGDINGDGLPDLLVGSLSSKGPPYDYRRNAGEGYVFYGDPALRDQVIDIALSSYPHLTIYGTDESIAADSFVSGDINGDGFDDLLVGMPHEPGPGDREAGALVVLYSSATMPAVIDLAAPSVPYTYLEGADRFDDTAYWSASGDVDGDGKHEVVANAMSGASWRNSRPQAGDARIVSGAWLTDHPAPPGTPTASPGRNESNLNLTWAPSTTPGITGYLVSHGLHPEADEQTVLVPGGSVTAAIIHDLIPFKRCYIKVAALIDDKPSRFTSIVTVTPGAQGDFSVSCTRLGKNEVQVDWNPAENPSEILGYWVYRRADTLTPTPADRVNGSLIKTNSFVDTGAPAYTRLYYRVSAVTDQILETDLSAPEAVFTRPDEVGSGTLLVNDYNWELVSDWWWPNVPADPFEMYEDSTLTGSLSFTFWDTRDWFRYPDGYDPIGFGPLDPQVLFDHGLLILSAHGPDNHKDKRIDDIEELLLEFYDAGGALLITGWNMGSYLPQGLADLFHIVDWNSPEAVTTSKQLISMIPQLDPVGPGINITSAPFCDVPELDGDPSVRTFMHLDTPAAPSLLLGVLDENSVERAFLLSASPAYLDHVALRSTIGTLVERLAQAYTQTGTIDPNPAVSPVSRAYPNPSRAGARVNFALENRGRVTATVLDLQGRVVRRLVDAVYDPGPAVVSWDGADDQGRPTPAGVYFLRLSTQEFQQSRRLLRLP